MSALLSFLGGSVFRAIWSEIAGFVNKKQDHQHETEMLQLQAQLDDAAHKRQIEQLQLQATLGIKTIEAQSEAAIDKVEADAFGAAVAAAMKPTGVVWVDAWNGIIRPLAASICLILWVFAMSQAGFKMSDWDKELVGVILGFWFASRVLSRGK